MTTEHVIDGTQLALMQIGAPVIAFIFDRVAEDGDESVPFSIRFEGGTDEMPNDILAGFLVLAANEVDKDAAAEAFSELRGAAND